MEIILIGIIVVLIICMLSILYCHYNIKISRYEIKSGKVLKELKLIHLSDLHSRVFRNNNAKLILDIALEKPDVIVMTGDMVNGKDKDIIYLEEFIQTIKAQGLEDCNIYYIMGNREFRYNEDNYIKLKDMLNANNVIVLENNKEIIDNNICIYGLNYYNRNSKEYYYRINKQNDNKIMNLKFELSENVKVINKNKYNILLVHDPNEFDKYAKIGFDLILAGHIHGGVIRVPMLNKGVLSPEVKFFPKYDGGIFEKDKSVMCVSSGLGYGTIPFRLFNSPEIVSIRIDKN